MIDISRNRLIGVECDIEDDLRSYCRNCHLILSYCSSQDFSNLDDSILSKNRSLFAKLYLVDLIPLCFSACIRLERICFPLTVRKAKYSLAG